MTRPANCHAARDFDTSRETIKRLARAARLANTQQVGGRLPDAVLQRNTLLIEARQAGLDELPEEVAKLRGILGKLEEMAANDGGDVDAIVQALRLKKPAATSGSSAEFLKGCDGGFYRWFTTGCCCPRSSHASWRGGMPNAIAATTEPKGPTTSARRLPRSVKEALANNLALGDPDLLWTRPATMPSPVELRPTPEILDGQSQLGERHVGHCPAKLVMAFEPNAKLTAKQTRPRLVMWLWADGDLGEELWLTAMPATIRGSQWMPKLAERQRRRERCRAVLDAHRATAAPKCFVREPEPLRMRTLRHVFGRMGNIAEAAVYERQLSEIERRRPQAWAVDRGGAT